MVYETGYSKDGLQVKGFFFSILVYGLFACIGETIEDHFKLQKMYSLLSQGNNARKVNCVCVYSAYILKPVLSGRCLEINKVASVFVKYSRRIKAFNFDNFNNSHNSFL